MKRKPRPDLAARNFRHGHTLRGARTGEYEAWVGMKARCHNPKHNRYPEWGGKGISVCAEWRNDFAAFLAHIGPRPSVLHSVDRMDGTKGYQPGNVRWATKIEQSNNRPSFCRIIEYAGKKQTMAQWARELGINRECLKRRLNSGWPVEEAFLRAVRAGGGVGFVARNIRDLDDALD